MTEQSRIENDLAETRTRLGGRLDELQRRLAPGRLAEDAISYFQGSDGGEFTQNLVNSAKANPIPAVLAGVGLAWLMVSNARAKQATGAAQSIRQNLPDWASADEFDDHLRYSEPAVMRRDDDDDKGYLDRLHSVRGKALGVARTASDTTDAYTSRMTDAIAATRDRLSRAAQDTRDGLATYQQSLGARATDMQDRVADVASAAGDHFAAGRQAWQESGSTLMNTVMGSPVMLGAIGLGVGALIAALIPTLDGEDTALSGMAGQARGAVKDVAQDLLDRSGNVVQGVLTAAHQSAKAHGLTGEKGLGDLAHDAGAGNLTKAVANVAKDALKAADDSIHQT